MSKLLTLIQTALYRLGTSTHWEEAYLNEAVDAADLERRMRMLDRAQHSGHLRGLSMGLESHR